MSQLGIALFGLTAIYFATSGRLQLQRWAPIFGLAAQPFWFWATITAEQWGMVLLCCAYTFLWARGVFNFWIRR